MSARRRRILIVDDDRMVLRGLRTGLRKRQESWDMRFAESGAAALAELEHGEVDVVVSDMRMPEMDGVELLQRVRRITPTTGRIIMTGYAEADAIRRVISLSHELLSKPFRHAELEDAINRAFKLHDALGECAASKVISRIPEQPPLPPLYHEVALALAHPEVSVGDLTASLERDPQTLASVLAVCGRIPGLDDMALDARALVDGLGPEPIAALVLVSHASATVGRLDAAVSSDLPHPITASAAFAAALMSGLGDLLVATYCPTEHAALAAFEMRTRAERHAAERALLGTTRAAIAAYALDRWGAGLHVIDAVLAPLEEPMPNDPDQVASHGA